MRTSILKSCDAVFWAMAYRSQPQHDLKCVDRKEAAGTGRADRATTARMLGCADQRHAQGTLRAGRVPKREFMESARKTWERLGLPALTPQTPWHGYDLGAWPAELERQAQMATSRGLFRARQRARAPATTPTSR